MDTSTGTRLYIVGGLLLGGGGASALDPADYLLFTKGAYSLRPQLVVSEIFNDNVYYRNDNKEADFITVISPGLILQLGTEDGNYISLSYAFERLQYLSESQLSANQHRIGLVSHIQFNRLTLDGRDDIEFLSSVLTGGISLRGTKVNRRQYLDEYRLTYEFSERTGLYAEVTHRTFDYESGVPLYDTTSVIGSLGFQYRAFSRSFLFGEVYYGQTHPERNLSTLADAPYASYVGAFLGARGNFTEMLTGTVKAGFESREFSDGTPGGDVPVVEVQLSQRFSEKTVLIASYSRRQNVSVQFARSGYTSDTVGAVLRQEIGNDGRCRAVLRGTYSLQDYEPHQSFTERTDHLVAAGAELSYDFKLWLKGRLGYDFERLDSNLPGIVDYDVNRVILGLTIGY